MATCFAAQLGRIDWVEEVQKPVVRDADSYATVQSAASPDVEQRQWREWQTVMSAVAMAVATPDECYDFPGAQPRQFAIDAATEFLRTAYANRLLHDAEWTVDRGYEGLTVVLRSDAGRVIVNCLNEGEVFLSFGCARDTQETHLEYVVRRIDLQGEPAVRATLHDVKAFLRCVGTPAAGTR